MGIELVLRVRTQNPSRVARAKSAHENVVSVLRVLNGDQRRVTGIEAQRGDGVVRVLEELRFEVGVCPRFDDDPRAL